MSYILNNYFRLPIEIERGEGARLFDANGKEYIDFMAGIAVNSLGHNNEKVNKTAHEQLDKVSHHSNYFTNPLQEKLAERLCKIANQDKAFFCSSGLEAVESAIKFIRKYGAERKNGAYEIITLNNGFHGRSMACISAGGNDIARDGFYPLLDGFVQVDKNDKKALENAITEKTAGILVEPLQAEGGIYALSESYIKFLRKIADEHDLILCFDEVQCGYGRTGDTLYHHQKFGVEADIIASAKGIGNGYPLAVVLLKDKVGELITAGTHGSTYGGSPLSMAIGNAVLDIIETNNFLKEISKKGDILKEGIRSIAHESIADVRGHGLLVGIEVKNNTKQLLLNCYENGLAVTSCCGGSVLRITPPLNITEDEIQIGLERLADSFKNL